MWRELMVRHENRRAVITGNNCSFIYFFLFFLNLGGFVVPGQFKEQSCKYCCSFITAGVLSSGERKKK